MRKYLPVSLEFGIKIEESSLAVDRTGSHLCSGMEARGKGTTVKFLFRWPPWSRSIETEVKISLSTSGKSSNFRADYFLNAMV